MRLTMRYFLVICLCFLSAPLAAAGETEREFAFDYLIQDALIFDGESPRGFTADLAVNGETIAQVGDLPADSARVVLDGRGLVLAPGFIDVHTHSDFNPLIYPGLPNKLLQGVTTEVTGNCGMSASPVIGTHVEKIHAIWKREGVEIPADIPWQTYRDYLGTAQQEGMMTNLLGLTGHGNLRSTVMGFEARRATAREIAAMKKLLDMEMRLGSAGISFGMPYLPGTFAGRPELVELCREAARHKGVCAFHIRSEGTRLLESLREIIEVARRAKAPVQISHLKASGKPNWDKIGEAFRLIEDARRRGIPVFADAYPYTAGCAELGVLLPEDLYGREDRQAFFENPANRKKILRALHRHFQKKRIRWQRVMIAFTAREEDRHFQRKSVWEIIRGAHQKPEAFLLDLLTRNAFEVSAFSFSQSPSVVERVIQKPYVMIGSDSIADGGVHPHPRCYGTFPRVLREAVREKSLLDWGEAIRKMTSLAAARFRIAKRGRILAGYYADLVIFDPGSVEDRATYRNPKKSPAGIRWVFVNGTPVVEEGRFNGTKNGRFLVHSQD